jgi:hypothetical protein
MQKAFNNVCAFIGTRDLVQEHIAYRVWPLVNDWEMPKETAAGSSQGGLVYLKYTFRYRDQFDEPSDDWLTCVETTSDELLGAYMRAKDDDMTLAFRGRGKEKVEQSFRRYRLRVSRLYLSLAKAGKEKEYCYFSHLYCAEGQKD